MTLKNRAFPKTQLAAAAGLIIGTSLLGAPFAYAGHPDDWGKDRGVDPMVQRMADDLDLSADQQTAVRKILDTERTQMEQQRAESRKQIDALLTDDQKAKRDTRMKRAQDRRLERMDDRLGLSDEQVTKIKGIFDEQRANSDVTRTQVRERIAAVLTDEQRDKVQDDARHHDRKDRGDRRDRKDCDPGENRMR